MSLEEQRQEKEILDMIDSFEEMSIHPDIDEIMPFEAESSQRKHDREESIRDEVLYRQYLKDQRKKMRSMPVNEKFFPKEGFAKQNFNITFLDLDCITNAEDILNAYLIENMQISMENKEKPSEAWKRFKRTCRGNVGQWVLHLSDDIVNFKEKLRRQFEEDYTDIISIWNDGNPPLETRRTTYVISYEGIYPRVTLPPQSQLAEEIKILLMKYYLLHHL